MSTNAAAMAALMSMLASEPVPVDATQAFCLAQNVWFEAEHGDDMDKVAIAMVVMNRVSDGRYPGTICEVVWQRSQFSWTHDGKSDRVLTVIRQDYVGAWATVVRITLGVLSGRLRDPTGGANHYHAHYVRPSWANGMEVTTVTTGHVFYRG